MPGRCWRLHPWSHSAAGLVGSEESALVPAACKGLGLNDLQQPLPAQCWPLEVFASPQAELPVPAWAAGLVQLSRTLTRRAFFLCHSPSRNPQTLSVLAKSLMKLLQKQLCPEQRHQPPGGLQGLQLWLGGKALPQGHPLQGRQLPTCSAPFSAALATTALLRALPGEGRGEPPFQVKEIKVGLCWRGCPRALAGAPPGGQLSSCLWAAALFRACLKDERRS